MRADQAHSPSGRQGAGSRSGAGDTAGALGYPGVPAAVPNLTGASLFQQNVSTPTLVSFNAPARTWFYDLSFTITSNNSFSLSTARAVASLQVIPPSGPPLVLATIELSVANPNQHDSGGKSGTLPGLPVINGTIVQLNVNGGATITNIFQEASCSVLYSYP